MKKQTYYFQSEVKQLLNLMINSLYSNKEIFVRELISNSLDAIDKLKFYYVSIKDRSSINLDNKNYYRIRIYVDRNKFIVSDNGIGMTKKEVIKNLGTIAKSGTKEFLNSINLNNKKLDWNNFIGQFGVGFYSSFMVSTKVVVHTRSIKELNGNNAVFWSSDGHGEYFIDSKFKSDVGTDVILYIKDDCSSFLNENTICNIVKKYSNYIDIPIEYKSFCKKDKKNIWKRINQFNAIWLKNKNEISKKEYIDFYLSFTNNLGKPLIWSHNKVEGKNEYISLLYIPDTCPWNIWNRDEYKNGIKLYIRRVFVMEDVKKILPFYLRFVQGIIDSSDLSLNVSREILQDNSFIGKLKISLTKRILKILHELSLNKKEYIIFWNQFGNILKEGLAEDINRTYDISLLLRFNSSFKGKDEYISLEEYLSNMKPGQDKIYYIISDNYLSSYHSPHLEVYKERNIEVLIMFDRIDEWMMTYLVDFKGIKFQSVSKNYIDDNKIITLNDNKILELDNNYINLINRIKNSIGDLVKDVKLTNRLYKFPVVLTTDSNDISTQMSKLLSSAGKKVPKVKYLFEINPNHLLIKYIDSIKDELLFSKWINFIYYQALLIESNTLDNPVNFIKIINDLFLSFIIK